jgi:hypothetical protein
MKKKVLRLIEEINPQSDLLTDDPDIANKINDVINQIQNEVARIKKIPAKEELEVSDGDEIDFSEIAKDLFQVNLVRGVENDIIGNTINFYGNGIAKVYYYKYPKQITYETKDDEFKFDLSTDVLEIMPYGIAADLLKSDISASYGQVYANRYEQMLQRLDPRYHTGSFYIEGDDTYEFL